MPDEKSWTAFNWLLDNWVTSPLSAGSISCSSDQESDGRNEEERGEHKVERKEDETDVSASRAPLSHITITTQTTSDAIGGVNSSDFVGQN